jgi:hypothetical protein
MFWVVQKATELGVHWILPVFTTRTLGPDDLAREKAHRWPAAILRAVAQCRRGNVPVLLPPRSLPEALAHPLWQDAVVRQALVEGGRSAGARKEFAHPAASAALLVGPEGGWAPEEVARIREAAGVPICLGGRILRAETAAIVGLTLSETSGSEARSARDSRDSFPAPAPSDVHHPSLDQVAERPASRDLGPGGVVAAGGDRGQDLGGRARAITEQEQLAGARGEDGLGEEGIARQRCVGLLLLPARPIPLPAVDQEQSRRHPGPAPGRWKAGIVETVPRGEERLDTLAERHLQ